MSGGGVILGLGFLFVLQEGGIRSAAVRDAVAARDAQSPENEEQLASDSAPSTGSPRISDRAVAAPHVSAAVGARRLESIFADEEEPEVGDGGEREGATCSTRSRTETESASA